MVINSQVDISGTEVLDVKQCVVKKTMDENILSSRFQVELDNPFGKNSDIYTVGDTVEIFADKDASPTTKIFNGILEDIRFDGEGTRSRLRLIGRDFTARLQDRTVEPQVYSNLTAGSIVKDIIARYTDDITTNNVDDSPTIITRIAFNHLPVYDAIKELANLANYTFFVDSGTDLHFNEKGITSSNLTFNSGNTVSAGFEERRDSVFNEVWVYGDRYLDNEEELFFADGTGSVFNLVNNPHNTDITMNGSIRRGAIEGVNVVPVSGTDYLVNFFDKKIIFVSGTTLNYNSIPPNNGSVLVKYKRSLPIVKVGRDQTSIDSFGKRVLKITDTEIKDPATAVDLVRVKLDELAIPKKQGNLNIRGVIDITPGNTCVVDFPWLDVNNQTYNILSASYDFNTRNNLDEVPLTIKVNKKLSDAGDTIRDHELRLKKLESKDVSDADILTRLEFTTGSEGVRTSGLFVSVRGLGSSFILGKGHHGVTGPTFGGILGSVIESGINFLGDSRSGLVVVFSGGFF